MKKENNKKRPDYKSSGLKRYERLYPVSGYNINSEGRHYTTNGYVAQIYINKLNMFDLN